MMEWDARPELMAEIRASIVPVQTDAALSKVLAEDFPRDCSDLPISGGWGYRQDEAIIFVRDRFRLPAKPNFAALEYHIIQKILYEELIIFRPKDYRFSGIRPELKEQSLIERGNRKYDRLEILVHCWTDWHWDQLKQAWETNEFGQKPGFDELGHALKREESEVKSEREFWFDVTEVFG